jgi:hypothetical protein
MDPRSGKSSVVVEVASTIPEVSSLQVAPILEQVSILEVAPNLDVVAMMDCSTLD